MNKKPAVYFIVLVLLLAALLVLFYLSQSSRSQPTVEEVFMFDAEEAQEVTSLFYDDYAFEESIEKQRAFVDRLYAEDAPIEQIAYQELAYSRLHNRDNPALFFEEHAKIYNTPEYPLNVRLTALYDVLDHVTGYIGTDGLTLAEANEQVFAPGRFDSLVSAAQVTSPLASVSEVARVSRIALKELHKQSMEIPVGEDFHNVYENSAMLLARHAFQEFDPTYSFQLDALDQAVVDERVAEVYAYLDVVDPYVAERLRRYPTQFDPSVQTLISGKASVMRMLFLLEEADFEDVLNTATQLMVYMSNADDYALLKDVFEGTQGLRMAIIEIINLDRQGLTFADATELEQNRIKGNLELFLSMDQYNMQRRYGFARIGGDTQHSYHQPLVTLATQVDERLQTALVQIVGGWEVDMFTSTER